jgi:hypothetical protein
MVSFPRKICLHAPENPTQRPPANAPPHNVATATLAAPVLPPTPPHAGHRGFGQGSRQLYNPSCHSGCQYLRTLSLASLSLPLSLETLKASRRRARSQSLRLAEKRGMTVEYRHGQYISILSDGKICMTRWDLDFQLLYYSHNCSRGPTLVPSNVGSNLLALKYLTLGTKIWNLMEQTHSRISACLMTW